MRRQDELLALYPGSDPLTRKFILHQLEELSLAFDSEELLELLQHERASDDPRVAHQALVSSVRFLPGYMRRRYALAGELAGAWSGYAGGAAARDTSLAEIGPAERTRREERLAAALAPLARALAASADETSALALALLAPAAGEASLVASVREHGRLDAVVALAQVRGASPAAREALEARVTGGDPDAWLAAGALGAERAAQLIRSRAGTSGMLARVNMAAVLGELDVPDHLDLARELMRAGEGWVAIWCLRALGATRRAAYVPAARKLFERAPHEFVRVQAVAAAAAMGGAEALELCLAALRADSRAVQAQALEALVRLRCPPDVLAREARPFVDGPSLRSRVNALLAIASPDASDLAPQLVDMLMSEDPVERIEGAYALGFIQNPRAKGCLDALIRLDPAMLVRVQAIKSLSKYPARDAIPVLVPLAAAGERRIARCAARVVARYDAEQGLEVSEAIDAELARAADQPGRALLYTALGTVSARSGRIAAAKRLSAGLAESDPACVNGALKGLCALQRRVSSVLDERVQALAASADARLAVRARQALFLAGDLESFASLPDRPELASALAKCALEIGLLGEDIVRGAFPGILASMNLEAGSQNAGAWPVLALAQPPAAESPADAPAPHDDPFPIQRPARVKRSLKSGAVARPSEPIAAPVASPDPVPSIEAKLRSARESAAVEAPLLERLRAVSYLVSMKPEALTAQLRPYAPLVAAAAALLAVAIVVLRGATAAPPAPELPRLAITSFYHKVVVSPPGGEPVLGAELAPRTRVEVGDGSSAVLETGQGATVQLGPAMAATIRDVDAGGRRLELEVTRGYCKVRFHGGEIHLVCGKAQLSGRDVDFTLDVDRGAHVLAVERGTLAASSPTLGTTELHERQVQPLEP